MHIKVMDEFDGPILQTNKSFCEISDKLLGTAGTAVFIRMAVPTDFLL